MHTCRDHSHGNFFSSFFRKLHSHAPATPLKHSQEIKSFDEDLEQQLEHLKPKEGDGAKLLHSSWLSRMLALALGKHKEAGCLIPPLDLVSDETWMNEYMDQTTRMLDVCNALVGTISNMEQGHLLIRYACHILLDAQKGPSEEKARSSHLHICEEHLNRACKSLRKWANLQVLNESPSQKLGPILQDMIKALQPPAQQVVAKGNGFLYALYGANVTAVFAFYMLSLALSQERELFTLSFSVSPAVSWSVSWSSTFLQLEHIVKNEVIEQKGTHVCLQDLGPLYSSVRELLCMVEQVLESKESPLPENAVKMLAKSANDLSLLMDEIANGLESLGTKLGEMFNAIVSSRSALLDKLGQFGTDS